MRASLFSLNIRSGFYRLLISDIIICVTAVFVLSASLGHLPFYAHRYFPIIPAGFVMASLFISLLGWERIRGSRDRKVQNPHFEELPLAPGYSRGSSQPVSKGLAMTTQGLRFLLIGLVVMLSGIILMIGGGSDDPNVFNYAMFDFRRLVAAPVVILAGVAIMIIAIVKVPKYRNKE